MTGWKALRLLIILCIGVTGIVVPACAADTLIVNHTGYWKNGGDFISAPANPITSALLDASAYSSVTVNETGDYPMVVNFATGVANGITLDLGGAILNGTIFGLPGIILDGKSDTTVKNGTIFRYINGIRTSGTCSNIRIEEITIIQPSEPGISLQGTVTNLAIESVNITSAAYYGVESTTGTTVNTVRIANSTISGMRSPYGDGIRFESGVSDILIENVTVTSPLRYGFTINQHSSGTNVTILNSTVRNALSTGFNIYGKGTIRLENNTAESGSDWGMYIVAPTVNYPLTFTDDNRIVNNNNGLFLQRFANLTLAPGSNLRQNRGMPVQFGDCTNITFRDTVIDNSGGSYYYGILMTGTSSNFLLGNLTIVHPELPGISAQGTVTNLTIEGVNITGATHFGIESTSTVNQVTVANSTISDMRSPYGDGIRFESGVSDILIENVTVTSPLRYGFTINQHSSGMNVTIRNSTVRNAPSTGFNIYGKGTIRLENNTAESGSDWGMYIVAPTANYPLTFTDDNRIVNNNNGLYLQRFANLTLAPGSNLRQNRGMPVQFGDCTNITFQDTVIDNSGGSYYYGVLMTGTSSNFLLGNLTIVHPELPGISAQGTVTNLTIEGVNITGATHYGIESTSTVNQVTVANSTISGMRSPYGDGIRFESGVSDILIENVTVTSPLRYGFTINQHSSGMNVTIRNSTVRNAPSTGFNIYGKGTIRLENNTAESGSAWGMAIVAPTANYPLTFTNDNRIVNCGNGLYFQRFANLTLVPGSNLRQNRGQPVQFGDCTNITFRDTVIDNSGGSYYYGVLMTGTSSNFLLENITVVQPGLPGISAQGSMTNLTVESVNITNAGTYGIEASPGTTLNTVRIANSTISTILSGTGDGVWFTSGVSDILIENVTVANPLRYGFHVNQHSSGLNVTIRNSTVRNAPSTGFNIYGKGTIRLENNTAESGSAWGMYIVAPTANYPLTFTDDNRIVNNNNGLFLQRFTNLTLAPGSNLRQNRGQPVQFSDCTNITFRDTVIDNSGGSYNYGVLMTGTSSNFLLENITVVRPGFPGISAQGSMTNLTVESVNVTNAGIYGIESQPGTTLNTVRIANSSISGITSGTGDGVWFTSGVSDILIENVTVTSPLRYGFHVNQHSSGMNVTIRNSTVRNAPSTGFNIYGKGTIRLENNTAESGSAWGMAIVAPTANYPLTFTDDNRIVNNNNGLFLQRFTNLTLAPGSNLRQNRGQPVQFSDCTNITFRDTVIDNSGGAYSYGVLMTGTSSNFLLENLTIVQPGLPGISALGTMTNLTIESVNITNAGIYGIEAQPGTPLNTVRIANSSISGITSGTGDGIWFTSGVSDILIENVTVTSPLRYGFHVNQHSSGTNVTIRNSTVRNAPNNGFHIYGKGTIRLENNTADSGSAWGMVISGSGNPDLTFSGNVLRTNQNGLSVSATQGNLTGSVFQNTGLDLTANADSRVNTVNTSFDKAKTTVSDTSVLNALWYLGITVTDPALSPVQDASVTVTNASGATILSGTTGPDGTIPRAALAEWTKNATAATFHTPFLLHAEKPGVGTNDTGLDLDRSTDVSLILRITAPVANFTANVTDGIAPLDVGFTDTSTGSGITGYQWILSDDPLTVYTEKNLTHTFAAGGIYDVNHAVTNEAGTAWLNRTGYVNVTDAPPVVNFTANGTAGIVPLSVAFNDTTTGTGITGYQWIFSDDPLTVYTGKNITHEFTSTGSFDVNHSVTNGAGTFWLNRSGYIRVTYPAPVVDRIEPASGIQGTLSAPVVVSGYNFLPPAQVNLTRAGQTNISLNVTNQNGTAVTGSLSIPASAETGPWNVTVTNPDGQTGTLPGAFNITTPVVPSITSISPKKKAAGSPKFTLTVNGNNFTSASIVRWSGSNRTTKYVSPVKLTAKITAKDVKKKGTKQVTVQNPGPGGGLSNAKPFKIV